MDYEQEMIEGIKRFMEYRYGNREYDLNTWPYWGIIWTWWQAIAEFKIKPNWFKSLDEAKDVPDGVTVTIMTKDAMYQCQKWKGKWSKIKAFTKDECKDIYGS